MDTCNLLISSWPKWKWLSLVPEDFNYFRSENPTMVISELDSFIWKFRKLLHSGKNAELVIKSEAGKAIVKLSAEVEIPPEKPHVQSSRNGPARQRRCERGAAERAAAAAEDVVATEATAEKASKERDLKVSDYETETHHLKDTVEVTELEAA